MRSSRARFVRGGAGAVAALVAPRLAGAQANPLRVACTNNAGYAGAYYAQDQGYFARAGLDVDVEALASGAAVTGAVAGRAVTIGITNVLPLVSAVERGIALRYLCAGELIDLDSLGFAVAANSLISSGKDLSGKTIGVSSLNDMAVIAIKTWIDRGGGQAASVRFVELPFTVMAQAIRSGRIDAGPINEPWLTLAKREGGLRFLEPAIYSVFAPRSMVGGWFAYADWIDANRDTARKFRTAIYGAAAWANAHPDDSAADFARHSGQDATLIRSTPRTGFGTALIPAMLQSIVDLAYTYKAIERPYDAADLIAQL